MTTNLVIALMIGVGVFSGIIAIWSEVFRGLFLYGLISGVCFGTATFLLLNGVLP